MAIEQPVRVRFEPAPSGSIHVGNAMTATFNWLFARKHKGTFVLRIADTDASRATEEAMRSVLEDLRWLGLLWDEGPEVGGPFEPYRQSERLDLYQAAADRLLEQGNVYKCYDTPEELEERRKAALAAGRPPGYDGRCRNLTDAERAAFEAEGRKPALRFRVEPGETVIHDHVHGEVRWDHSEISDFVIMRSDRTPTYLLTVTYDDDAMGVTHVIRGEDILASTPRQLMIARALGATRLPEYAHVPLIVGSDRAPLSKRHGHTSVAAYRDDGYLPEALINYLVLLNWSIGDGVTERFTIPELIQSFDLGGVTRNPSAFDVMKLTALNGEKIRELDPDEFVERIRPFMARAEVLHEPIPDEEIGVLRAMAPHVQTRITKLTEAPEQLRFLFYEPVPDEKASALLTPERAPLLEQVESRLSSVEPWSVEAIHDALMAWADETGLKRKDALQPVRAAITGSLVSPPLFESIEVLGRDRATQRLRNAAGLARHGD
ncbi:MAG TPA: glutamate--tRNA ligase [Actinomycetota bacterium]|nr:glutamate--tRNA ligase [Actinomycetota bacterium]